MTWLLLAAYAVTLASTICAWILIRRYNRGLRQLRDAQLVLHVLCVQAFRLRHAPIWQAWANVMGNIAVTVESAQFTWDNDPQSAETSRE